MTLRFTLVIFALSWTSIATLDASPTKHPNIILFFVDDMGWSDLGVYGSVFYETPNIDEFAAQGVRFTDAYAASHVCSPTRASLMTGKYPARLQLTDWLPGRPSRDADAIITAPKAAALALDETTIAEAFKANGYRTAIIGKWHLGEGEYGPTNQGFDFQVPLGSRCCPKGGYHPPYEMEGLSIKGREDEYLTDRLTEFALNFIGESSEQPYFLYMSHFAVHDPIQGRSDLVAKYQQKLAAQPQQTGPAYILEGNPDDPEPLTRAQLDTLIQEPTHIGRGYLPNRTVQVKQHQDNVEFAAMVESVDESLGQILQALEANDNAENTIVVFYSDNGGLANGKGKRVKSVPVTKDTTLIKSFEDKRAMYAAGLRGATSNLPLRGAKGWLYEGGIRVPLIVHWPGQGKKGLISNLPVNSPDFYPTLLEMAGLSPLPHQHVDGVSFADAVKGKSLNERSLFWHFPHYSNHGQQSPGGAIRSGHYKLIEYFENGTTQLFNLQNDPGEQTDLVNQEPELVSALLAELRAWREDADAAMPIGR